MIQEPDSRLAAFRLARFREARRQAEIEQSTRSLDEHGFSYSPEVNRAAFGGEPPDPNYIRDIQERNSIPGWKIPAEFARSVANAPGQALKDLGEFGDLVGSRVLGTDSLPYPGGVHTPLKAAAEAVPQIPHVPGMEGSLADKLGAGVGFVGTAAIPGALGVRGAMALVPGVVMGAASNGVALHQKVLDETGDADKAMLGLLAGAGVGGGLSVLPVARVLARINGESGGVLVRALQDVGAGVVYGGGQSALNDVFEEHLTDKDIPILENAIDAGALGGLTMLIAGGVAHAGAKVKGKLKPPTDAAPAEAGPPTIESVLSAENGAGKPHAATAEVVQEGQTHVETAPPERVVDVGEAVPGERAAESKSDAVETPAPIAQASKVPGGNEPSPASGAASSASEGAAPIRLRLRETDAEAATRKRAEDLREPRSPDELSRYADEIERADRANEQRLLGDKADAWRRWAGRDEAKAQAIEKEAGLSPRQVDSLYGIGDPRPNPADLRSLASELYNVHAEADAGNWSEVETLAARAMRKLATKGDTPEEWIDRAPEAYRTLETIQHVLGQHGKDPVEFSRAAIEKAARAFSDPNDAADVLRVFLENMRAPKSKTAEKIPLRLAEPKSEPAPEKLPVESPAPEPKAKLPVRPSDESLTFKIGGVTQHLADIFGAKPPVGGKVKETLRSPEEGFYPSAETKWQAAQRKIADRFVKLRATEQEAPAKGSDFSGAETRMHGRAAHAQDLLDRAQDRAVRVMKDAGLTAQDMADYATARHAERRNAIIAERSKGENLEGSGMSNARAAEVLANAKPGAAEAMRVHDEVRDKALDFAVESGLVSKEEAKAWREKFGETFSSLKTIGDEEARAMPGVGKSLQVRGKEAKRAEGRTTEATNPFVSMFQNAQDIILRGEKNLVAQEFGKLVENNPGPWAEFVKPDGPHAPSGEDIFTYKDAGEPKYIRVHDAATLKALKNLDPVAAGTLLRVVAKAGRLMSGLATSRNPEFIASNLARDLQTAVGNVTAEESVKIAGRIVKDVGPSLRTMYRAAREPEAATGYAKEYLEHGALTDWIEPTTPQQRLASMEKRLAETPVREKLRTLADAVSDISGSVENATRFAYFKALREQGVSADDAAVRAKELTVNWSKKGEWSSTMNALYLFSSANANGTVRFAQAWVRNPKRAAAYAGTLAAAGYAMAVLNSTAGGKDPKDDREWWDKQSDSNKRRYAMVQHDNGSTTRLPLAPGWGWFYYLGGKLYDWQQTGKPDVGNVLASAVDQASPIGGGSLGQFVSPWFLDPFVSASENKDFAGRPVYTDRDSQDKRPYVSLPGEQRASATAKAISRLANELTGGNDSRQGGLDIPPRSLDYIAAESGSGVGRFMQRVGKTITQSLSGEVPMWRDMPIIARFKGDAPKTYSRDFYAALDQIDAEDTAMKGGKDFDASVLSFKVAASKARTTIQKLRAAGLDDEADSVAADFIKAFDARNKR